LPPDHALPGVASTLTAASAEAHERLDFLVLRDSGALAPQERPQVSPGQRSGRWRRRSRIRLMRLSLPGMDEAIPTRKKWRTVAGFSGWFKSDCFWVTARIAIRDPHGCRRCLEGRQLKWFERSGRSDPYMHLAGFGRFWQVFREGPDIRAPIRPAAINPPRCAGRLLLCELKHK
jgi:hypothetical protein